MTKKNITEEMITEQICGYLSYFSSGQLNRIAPGGFFKNGTMRKHKSKYIKRGMADIQFILNGMFFAFEIKTPAEHKYIIKHGKKIADTPPDLLNKKRFHIWEQIQYLEGVRRNGFVGEFISNVDQVQEILYKHISR